MALSRRRTSFFIAAILLGASSLAPESAALADEFILSKPSESCRVFQFVGRAWIKASPDALGAPGSRIQALPISGRDNELILTRGINRFAVTKSCLAPVSGERASSLDIDVAYLSWQQPGVLLGPDGTGYAMVATLRGTQAGVRWRKKMRENLELGAGAWGYLGSGDLGAPSSTSATLPVSYAPQGVASRGAAGEITLGFRPGKDRIVIGPVISLLYESTDWPTPDGGSQIASSQLMTVLTLRSRFELGRWSVENDVGIIGAVSNLFWSLGVGFKAH